jgi:hypothetical protein
MYKWFSVNELKCKCGCNTMSMNEEFMRRLDVLRDLLGEPVSLSSAYRCPTHDESVNGGGEHTTGFCVDIKCPDSTKRFMIVSIALELGFNRIGLADNFCHIGLNEDYPQNVIWLYK